jgi:hypothetical protein
MTQVRWPAGPQVRRSNDLGKQMHPEAVAD